MNSPTLPCPPPAPELLSLRERKARKAYVCNWCGETIPAGTRYKLECAFAGSYLRVAWHLECLAVSDAKLSAGWDGRYHRGEYARGSGEKRLKAKV